MEKLWDLDVIGITPEKYTHLEEQALDTFHRTTQYQDGRYTVRLPFKGPERPAVNFARALAQLHSMKQSKRPDLFGNYQKILKEYLEAGFIEPVTLGDDVDGQVHYLPHHPVFKQSVTTPMRIVFNASSKGGAKELSLNDALYTGPNLAQQIQTMILSFRQSRYAATADISKAFLRVGIHPDDRDFCRFLFYQDPEMKQLVGYRFKAVPFGATCSPYLLNQTIQHHLSSYQTDLATRLSKAFYVDNWQTTFDDPDQMRQERPEITQIMATANMPLGQWVTSAAELEDFEPLGPQDYLGLEWNTAQDTLSIKLPSAIADALHDALNVDTKRKVVSLFSSLYDPAGFLAPVTLNGKLFIQRLWLESKGWDSKLSLEQRTGLRTTLQN